MGSVVSRVGLRLGDKHESATIAGERVRIGDATFTIERMPDGIYRVSGESGQQAIAVAGPSDRPWVFVNGMATQLEVDTAGGGKTSRRTASHDLSSPMPATVIKVAVEPGASVAKGDRLLVLEAMKMELPIRAPADGVVTAVHCQVGELVQPGVPLLDFV
jgi:biotin carboxyl carrier protein